MFMCLWENSHFLCIKHTQTPTKYSVFLRAVWHFDVNRDNEDGGVGSAGRKDGSVVVDIDEADGSNDISFNEDD